ncbi:guanylate kinase [Ruminococcus sp. AM33-14]|nr:guanylate kinase [Ruminococcus sp. AM33-14]
MDRYYRWDDSCIKATLLLHAKTEHEVEEINWKYELRTPLFEKDDLVEFDFNNGTKKIRCKGIIAGTDIYRVHGKIEEIEYDIYGKDYRTFREKCLYKHIAEKYIKETLEKLIIISGFSGVGKGTVIHQLLIEHPEKYVVSVSATTRKPRKGEVNGKSYHFITRKEFEELVSRDEFLEFSEYAGEYYGTLKKEVYKNYFKGKNVIIEINSQGARQIRKQQKIQSVFLIPPSFEELLHRLKNRGTESEESIRRRLKQALNEIEHIEEYGVILVNDSVEATAFVVDTLFHPALKHACGCNERELNIVKEIREGIIRYLSNGSLSDRGIY